MIAHRAFAIVFAAFVSGCIGVPTPVPSPAEDLVAYDQFVFIDDDLADGEAVWIDKSGARRTATGTLEVWAQLRNQTGEPIELEARVRFFDRDRVPLEGPSGWTRMFLTPKGITTFRAFSTGTTEVIHFYVEIQEGA